MTVDELKEILDHYDPTMEVILSIDAEGNRYRPLADVDIMAYANGEVGLLALTLDGVPAVILWPV